MQITLTQDEIHEAVEGFVRNKISIQTTQTLSIDFTMGRSGNGLTATLDIKSVAASATKPMTYRGEAAVPVVKSGTVFNPKAVLGRTLGVPPETQAENSQEPEDGASEPPVEMTTGDEQNLYSEPQHMPETDVGAENPEPVEPVELVEESVKPATRPSIFAKAV